MTEPQNVTNRNVDYSGGRNVNLFCHIMTSEVDQHVNDHDYE